MKKYSSNIGKKFLIAAIGTAACHTASAAQYALEEVIVTAQKRPQTLQDVPLSVSAMDGEFIAEATITEISGLGEFVPNLQTASSPFNGVLAIRGLGSGAANRAFEQSVAMFIDGAYAGRSNQFLTPFFDVERIEVVRGPQGVLFGKNAIAGGVSVVSAKPSDEFEASVQAAYEFENDGYALETIVSGPISSNLRGRLALKSDLQGAYMDNITTGDDDNGEIGSYVIRGSLEWAPTTDLIVGLKLEAAQRDLEGNLFQLAEVADTGLTPVLYHALGGDLTEDLDDTRSADADEFTDIDTDNIALNVEYGVEAGTFTFASSYSGYDYHQRLDADMTNLDLMVSASEESFEQFSQEIRFASEPGNTIDYIVGANYLDQQIDLFHGFDLNFPTLNPMFAMIGAPEAPFGVSPRWQFDQTTRSWSAFAEVTWNIRDDFRVSLGVRYTEEEKEASQKTAISVLGAPFIDNASARSLLAASNLGWVPAPLMEDERNEESLDPSLKIQWDLNPDVQVYAALAKATKAGGFDSQNTTGDLNDFSFDEEEVKSIELGTKMNLADGAAQLNLAVFKTQYTNLQVSSFNGAIFTIENAAESTIEGFEVDGRWRLSEGLTIGGAMAYLDAQFDDFPGFSCVTQPIGVPSACDPASNNGAGVKMSFAPEWSGNVWAEYNRTVFDGWELRSRFGANYSDDVHYAFDRDPLDVQDAFWKVNARVGLTSANETLSLALSIKNLTDKQTFSYAGDAFIFQGNHFASTTVGRQIFFEVKRRF
jgi:outer membrane receptor protein involved in Fe transport